MVKEIKKKNEVFYQCQECGFYYREREWAQKCEKWCKEHKSCNLEIIKHSIKLSTGSSLDRSQDKNKI
jgi:predicted ATP-dependent serine protease